MTAVELLHSTSQSAADEKEKIKAQLKAKAQEKAKLARLMMDGGSQLNSKSFDSEILAKLQNNSQSFKTSTSRNNAGGGSKGKEGNTDHTAGKCQFARPCTVGWKSQNQPLARGGGGRTPRMKST